jgi:hypothetical protein
VKEHQDWMCGQTNRIHWHYEYTIILRADIGLKVGVGDIDRYGRINGIRIK